MSKRGADKYITDQNWDEEEEVEEAGQFKKADTSVLQQRQVKKGKRRVLAETTDSGTGGVFAAFTGFSKTCDNVPSSAFGNIGSKTLTFTASSSHKDVVQDSCSESQAKTSPFKENDSTRARFLNELKSLNEGVAKWIKEHVDKNPYCVLTPIFKDYEKYFSELENKYPQQKTSVVTTEKKNSSEKQNLPEVPQKLASLPFGNSISESGGFKPTFSNSSKEQVTSDLPELKSDVVDNIPAASKEATPGLFASQTSASNLTQKSESSTFSGFTFGSGMSSTFGNTTSSASGLSFACAKPVGQKDGGSTTGDTDEEYVPPKADVAEVKEDDAMYSKRCKLFFKKDEQWKEKGIGNLHIKPCGEKFQLLIRADTNLGNILLNIMLSSSVPVSRQGKNNVTIVCVPNPALDAKQEDSSMVPMLIRVKTEADADELFELLKKHKN